MSLSVNSDQLLALIADYGDKCEIVGSSRATLSEYEGTKYEARLKEELEQEIKDVTDALRQIRELLTPQ